MDLSPKIKEVETRAHVNIALIKYWGKKDEILKIAHQSSISLTLDEFYTDTRVSLSKIGKDVLIINDVVASKKEYERMVTFLNMFRALYHQEDFYYIDSKNHVYKAAGLASSASAFASIALALSTISGLNLDSKELSKLARLGSGSASRSIYGGFSYWVHGDSHDSSYALSLDLKWPELVMAVILVKKDEKKVSSTIAMQASVEHETYAHYLKKSRHYYQQMMEILPLRNINQVGEIMQENSDLMHQTIENTGISFYEEKTKKIIGKIKLIQKTIPLYYTIDAGPNVKILTTNSHVEALKEVFNEYEIMICKAGPGAYVKNKNEW